MMTQYRHYIWLAMLLLLAAFSAVLLKNILDEEQVSLYTDMTPDAYAQKIKFLETDETGHWKHLIEADTFTHYAANDKSVLQRPTITILKNQNSPPWIITGNEGEALAGYDTVTLSGNVKAYQPAGLHSAPTTILTESIDVKQKENLADTDAHVTIYTPDTHIEADGMTVYLKEKHVKLHHNVRGRYVPAATQ